ncbi:Glucose-6-phosphate 1-dehydrogenase [Beijerinckiaceae bacterium RH AL1]|nr:glucose-6-phosphate dehydrogenase [Beijerinckiaceae bacterium]VVB47222.1 Glucose-6-phosphate 1-dehydrogenase [Beijerinckiaceae bacterium RH CH11]VVB47305.1 Glucose-6-phosphate 1-dehydrogenase [Beijerinckiaceae bacterium RH AL8]VVC55776.1 Glucose-6-phosphate 1-dehydrogenase [Beijerinckiaceae bacterium RH AL1]
MTSRIIAVDPFDLIVFGGTGDLAYRKLFPSLYMRDLDGQISNPTRIFGLSRQDLNDATFRTTVEEKLHKFVRADDLTPAALDRFLGRLHYVRVDALANAGWDELKQKIADGLDRVRAFYLATAPELFDPITHKLAAHGLLTPKTRVVLEKPLGKDLRSAQAINSAVGEVLDEQQIYRIDHYLGKETVQNLMALRFANLLFEPVWNKAHVDHVQITVAETVGLEGRGGYYDTAGALRDMLQNHMLQLLCLVAMEPPSAMEANALRDEKLKVLRALAPIDDSNVRALTVRGQYKAGVVDGKAVPGYLEELPDKNESATETFVALKAHVQTWRWAGVPFYLRTGKRLPSRLSEIVIQFREVPLSVFGPASGQLSANQLVIRLQPDEGVKLYLMIKDPGPGGMRFREESLNLSFAETFKGRNPDAYERLLMDVIRGSQQLFMRRDEVEAAWTWADPILDAWSRSSQPMATYSAGVWGPSAAVALIERDGRTWHESPSL